MVLLRFVADLDVPTVAKILGKRDERFASCPTVGSTASLTCSLPQRTPNRE